MIALAPGLTTILVDVVCWAGLTALAQGVMRLVAGRAAADRLARRPWESAEAGSPLDPACHPSISEHKIPKGGQR